MYFPVRANENNDVVSLQPLKIAPHKCTRLSFYDYVRNIKTFVAGSVIKVKNKQKNTVFVKIKMIL